MKTTDVGLLGTWALVAAEFRADDGSIQYPMGQTPAGVLIYSEAGIVSVQITHGDRAPFRVPDLLSGTPEELKAAFSTYTAYFGTFDYDPVEQRMVHHIRGSLFPNWIGSEQVRYVALDEDRMELRSAKFVASGREGFAVLVWRRMK